MGSLLSLRDGKTVTPHIEGPFNVTSFVVQAFESGSVSLLRYGEAALLQAQPTFAIVLVHLLRLARSELLEQAALLVRQTARNADVDEHPMVAAPTGYDSCKTRSRMGCATKRLYCSWSMR